MNGGNRSALQKKVAQLYESVRSLMDNQIKPPRFGVQHFTELILNSFSEAEFIELVTTLGQSYDSLPGEAYSSKVFSLYTYSEDRATLGDLTNLCAEKRPNVEWPNAEPLDAYWRTCWNDLSPHVSIVERSTLMLEQYFRFDEIVQIAAELDSTLIDFMRHLRTRLHASVCVVLYAFESGRAEALLSAMKSARPSIQALQQLTATIIDHRSIEEVSAKEIFTTFSDYVPFAEQVQSVPTDYILFGPLLNQHFSKMDLREMLFDSGSGLIVSKEHGKTELVEGLLSKFECPKAREPLYTFVALCHIRKPEVDWYSAANVDQALILSPDYPNSYVQKCMALRALFCSLWTTNGELLSFCELNFPRLRQSLSLTLSLRENVLAILGAAIRNGAINALMGAIERDFPVEYSERFDPEFLLESV